MIGFDARDREDKENHFGSCFWSYFDGEKSEMVSEKTRKKIAFFQQGNTIIFYLTYVIADYVVINGAKILLRDNLVLCLGQLG